MTIRNMQPGVTINSIISKFQYQVSNLYLDTNDRRRGFTLYLLLCYFTVLQ